MSAPNGSRATWLTLSQALPPDAQFRLSLALEQQGLTAALSFSAAEWEKIGLDGSTRERIEVPDNRRLAALTDWLAAKPNRHLLTLEDAAFPQTLRQLDQIPPMLWVEGSLEALSDPQLAIVGSRNCTRGGASNARDFAKHLSASGLTISSGLALGIDAAAHEGTLASAGVTVAVLGNGLDKIYPRENSPLAQQILANGGTLVSEYPPGVPPDRHRFPARNRLIAALSLGTLVVEAAERSGALITARLAAELGREVFAIPGSIHNPMAKGCHRLIREGAKLIDASADILAELSPRLAGYLTESTDTATPASPDGVSAEPQFNGDPLYDKVLNVLGHDPVGLDALTQYTGLTSAELSSMLLILELEGFIEALPGQRFSRIS